MAMSARSGYAFVQMVKSGAQLGAERNLEGDPRSASPSLYVTNEKACDLVKWHDAFWKNYNFVDGLEIALLRAPE